MAGSRTRGLIHPVVPAWRRQGGYSISFIAKGSQYLNTASPLTPRICNTLDFCNVRVCFTRIKDFLYSINR